MSDSTGWWEYAIKATGMPLAEVPVIILSAIAVYFAFLILVRFSGARALTITSASDAALVTMLGAVGGRGILGLEPTVASGLLGLLTLFALEYLFHGIRETWLARALVVSDPIVVFANGKPVQKACERTRTTMSDLTSAMRSAGVAELADVQLVILEPQGGYSIIHAGTHIDPAILEGVVGAEHLEA